MLQTLSAALLPIMLVTSLLNNTNNDVTENSYKNEVVFELEEKAPDEPEYYGDPVPEANENCDIPLKFQPYDAEYLSEIEYEISSDYESESKVPRLKYCSGERQNASEERLKPTVKHMKRCSALTRQTASCFSSIRQLSIIYLTVCL